MVNHRSRQTFCGSENLYLGLWLKKRKQDKRRKKFGVCGCIILSLEISDE
jgi:hypothetical protein